MNIETIIKTRRGELRISQQELAEMAGVSLATVKDIERGAGNPSLRTLMQIGEVLGLEVNMELKNMF